MRSSCAGNVERDAPYRPIMLIDRPRPETFNCDPSCMSEPPSSTGRNNRAVVIRMSDRGSVKAVLTDTAIASQGHRTVEEEQRVADGSSLTTRADLRYIRLARMREQTAFRAISVLRITTGGWLVGVTLLVSVCILAGLWMSRPPEEVGPSQATHVARTQSLVQPKEEFPQQSLPVLKQTSGLSRSTRVRIETLTVIVPTRSERAQGLPRPGEVVTMRPTAKVAAMRPPTAITEIPPGQSSRGEREDRVTSRVSPSASSPTDGSLPVGPGLMAPSETSDATVSSTAAVTSDIQAVRLALKQYETAYDKLDVAAAANVWPSLDRRALTRAFATLRAQTVTIQDCDIRVDGASASARCHGVIEFIPKIGGTSLSRSPTEWLFVMNRDQNDWKIRTVTAFTRSKGLARSQS